ncbi:AAA family ATPase [Paenibacillus sp. BK720]|uniref:AAA family ATPase n=1 Tax=Paenibacillus sp. BK720 TaxID=2587092 RepID=UPI0014205EA9|nr:AAA family ATPase [Paenibacillus sp. BK720]NIK69126.1 DNA repair exonuclease SbcCD ATPase subunit [Paenibacillus sp. BK720]
MIKLPKLTRVQIFSHPIYQTNIDWSINTGFNFVIGANGLGKTTFLNCIHYGISGNSGIYEQFKKLLRQRNIKNEIRIVVTFLVEDAEIQIERKIPDSSTNLLITQNNSIIQYSDPIIVDEQISQLVGIDNISDLDFLLGNFLIRQEEAKNVLWSSSVQSRVLRILFQSSEFRKEYNSLRDIYGQCHTDHNQKRYHASKLKNDIDNITKEAEQLQKLLEEKGVSSEEHTLIDDLNKEQARYDKITGFIEEIQDEVLHLNDQYEIILNEMEEVEKHRLELENKIGNSENKIYSEVYQLSPVNTMAYDELTRLGHCVYCDTTVDQKTIEAILKKSQHNCFFCGSDLPDQVIESELSLHEEELDKYKIIESKRRHLELQDKRIRDEKNKLIEELRGFKRELSDSENKLEKYKFQLEFLPQELKEINRNLAAAELRKEVLEKQWHLAKDEQLELERKRDEAEQELIKLEEENKLALEKIVDDLGSEIQKISKFMGLNVSLTTEKVPHETEKRIDVHIFVPMVHDILRNSPEQLSKSQSILLDYAFRMALINYYLKDKPEINNAMFLLETSEGSFDAAYVKWLAEALKEFSTNNVSFIVVVNLSNKEFLKSLFKKVEHFERSSRTLNVFMHGILQEAHIKGRADYAEIWKELFGTESVF